MTHGKKKKFAFSAAVTRLTLLSLLGGCQILGNIDDKEPFPETKIVYVYGGSSAAGSSHVVSGHAGSGSAGTGGQKQAASGASGMSGSSTWGGSGKGSVIVTWDGGGGSTEAGAGGATVAGASGVAGTSGAGSEGGHPEETGGGGMGGEAEDAGAEDAPTKEDAAPDAPEDSAPDAPTEDAKPPLCGHCPDCHDEKGTFIKTGCCRDDQSCGSRVETPGYPVGECEVNAVWCVP